MYDGVVDIDPLNVPAEEVLGCLIGVQIDEKNQPTTLGRLIREGSSVVYANQSEITVSGVSLCPA